MQQIQPFSIIGIAVRTTNENNQSSTDIPALWNRFMTEGIKEKIPVIESNDIYCLYTDYEKDHTKPYTTILGCKVSSLENIPEGMTGKFVEGGSYQLHIAKGDLMQNVVFNEWLKIWASDIPRIFTTDFEVYGAKTQDMANAEVEIFLAVGGVN